MNNFNKNNKYRKGNKRRSPPKPPISNDDDADSGDNDYDMQESNPSEDEIQINIEINNKHRTNDREMSMPTQTQPQRRAHTMYPSPPSRAHTGQQRRGGSFNPPPNKVKNYGSKYSMDIMDNPRPPKEPQDRTLPFGRFRSNSDPTMSPNQAKRQQRNKYQQLNIMTGLDGNPNSTFTNTQR